MNRFAFTPPAAVAPLARREDLAVDGALSVADAAAFVGLSESELYARMAAGELPFVKLGRRRVIPRRALVRMLAEGMTAVEAGD